MYLPTYLSKGLYFVVGRFLVDVLYPISRSTRIGIFFLVFLLLGKKDELIYDSGV